LFDGQRSVFQRARFTKIGMQLHLDAALPATVTRDGSNNVSVWKDKSGKSRDMGQGTTANMPLFLPTGLGGLGALQFDGSNDFMTFSDQTLAYIAGTSFTMIYVIAKPANNNTYIIGGQGAGTRNNLFSGYLQSNTHRFGFGNDDQGSIVNVAAVGATEIFTHTFNASTNERIVRRNRVEVSRAVSGGSLSGMSGQALGRYSATYGSFKIGEFILYNRALQFAEYETVEKDLMSKWSITLGS
jgi:hypothetical protein